MDLDKVGGDKDASRVALLCNLSCKGKATPLSMLPSRGLGRKQSWVLLPSSEIGSLVLTATELVGGAPSPLVPPSFPISAGGTVQGVWPALGPVLFLTCTVRESSYEGMKSGGHEKRLQVVQNDSVESGTTRPESLIFLSRSLLPIHTSFKCEVAPEQKNLEDEGKARHLHNYLPCGKLIWTQMKTFIPSPLACWFLTLFHVSKGI